MINKLMVLVVVSHGPQGWPDLIASRIPPGCLDEQSEDSVVEDTVCKSQTAGVILNSFRVFLNSLGVFLNSFGVILNSLDVFLNSSGVFLNSLGHLVSS